MKKNKSIDKVKKYKQAQMRLSFDNVVRSGNPAKVYAWLDELVSTTHKEALKKRDEELKKTKKHYEEILDMLVDVGYTLEVLEDYIIDKQWIQIKKHFYHIKGTITQIPKKQFNFYKTLK